MAIALDATSSGTANGTSLTYSHTCAAGAVLFVGVANHIPTGITYNGAALTKISEVTSPGNTSLWLIKNPSSGANNIVVSWTTSGYVGSTSISYTGADTTTTIGTPVTNTATPAAASLDANVTTTAANSVITDYIFAGGGSAALTASGTGHTKNVTSGFFDGEVCAGGTTTAASITTYTLGYTVSPNEVMRIIAVEVFIAAATSAIKTVNGLAKASVKTVNGLAIASVKTFNGLA